MKHIKNVLCGLLLLGTVQLYALPYSPVSKKGFIASETNPVIKDTSLHVFVPVVLNDNQPIHIMEDCLDKKNNPGKKGNRFKERKQVVIGISQATGYVVLGILEFPIEIAAQFCY